MNRSFDKEKIAFAAKFSLRALSRSIRDMPFGIVLMLLAFYCFCPDSLWLEIIHLWKIREQITDTQVVMLINSAKKIIYISWFAALYYHMCRPGALPTRQPVSNEEERYDK